MDFNNFGSCTKKLSLRRGILTVVEKVYSMAPASVLHEGVRRDSYQQLFRIFETTVTPKFRNQNEIARTKRLNGNFELRPCERSTSGIPVSIGIAIFFLFLKFNLLFNILIDM